MSPDGPRVLEFRPRRADHRVEHMERDHQELLEFLDHARGELHASKDPYNCLAILAVGPAVEKGDSGKVTVMGKFCCRWHSYALLGALDELRHIILQHMAESLTDD